MNTLHPLRIATLATASAMTAERHPPPRWTGVFGAPLIVGALSLAGLLAALLAGNFGRYFSWIAVALPVVIVTIVWLRPRFRR